MTEAKGLEKKAQVDELIASTLKDDGVPAIDVIRDLMGEIAKHQQMMGIYVNSRLKSIGEGVEIYPMAKLVKPEVIEIGDFSAIDDFVFMYGGKGIKIGRYVHICTGARIIGGGELIVEDYSSITQNVVMVTGTDTFKGGARTSACLPSEQRNPFIGRIYLEKDSFVGAGSVVMPDVHFGRGAFVGANSYVPMGSILKPMTKYAGSPIKEKGKRPEITREEI